MTLLKLLRYAIIGLSASLLLGSSLLYAETLRIGINQPPAIDPLTALNRAILTEAYGRLKQPIEFVELPLRRSLTMLLAGELDANSHRVPELLDSHPSLVRVATPLAAIAVRVYSLDRHRNIAEWKDLGKLRVAYTRGLLAIERGLPKDCRRVEAADHAEVFRLLKEDFADVAVLGELHDGPLDPYAVPARAVRLDAVLDRVALHHYLHGRHRALGNRLDAELKKIVNSAAHEELRRNALRRFY